MDVQAKELNLKSNAPAPLNEWLDGCKSRVISVSGQIAAMQSQKTVLELIAERAREELPEGSQVRAVLFLAMIDPTVRALIYFQER